MMLEDDMLDQVTPRQWITVSLLVYANLINYMDRLVISGLVQYIRKEYSATNAMMGLLQTAFIVSYMVFAPLFGYLGDRYSRKVIMIVGISGWTFFSFTASMIQSSPESKGWTNKDFWIFLFCRMGH